MKKGSCIMKKVLCIFLALLFLFSLSVPVCAEDAGNTGSESETSQSALDTSSFGAFLVSLIKVIANNLKTVSAEDLLKLPANAMADITTAIFQVLRLLGSLFGAIGGAA